MPHAGLGGIWRQLDLRVQVWCGPHGWEKYTPGFQPLQALGTWSLRDSQHARPGSWASGAGNAGRSLNLARLPSGVTNSREVRTSGPSQCSHGPAALGPGEDSTFMVRAKLQEKVLWQPGPW